MNIENILMRVRLAADLMCEAHKKDMRRHATTLIQAINDLQDELPMTAKSREEQATKLAQALFSSSDATQQDFEIVDGKVWISVPMHIDPMELAKRMIW